ncbi:erythromycin esterase family protein [Achromobacter sp. MYb9]|uniref:erythromycin esterase family protein n=1 Tax=Achromobacter sp. MYb9 TaxID=1827284 RepID=UPI002714D4D1|nr:erythromycin esterase family protein [Achromobacter sp. MYb9]
MAARPGRLWHGRADAPARGLRASRHGPTTGVAGKAPGLCRTHLRDADAGLRQRLETPRLERFIGVIYRPETERQSHYAKASLPQQFDAYLWMDQTHAVEPLPGPQGAGTPETWPFGL